MIEVVATVLLGLVSVAVGADVLAQVARFRRYIKLYPSAPKGDVWKHVKA